MSMLSQIRNWLAGPMDGSTLVYSVKNHRVQLCTDTGTRLANNCACRCSIKAMDRHSVDHEKVSTAGYTAIDEFEIISIIKLLLKITGKVFLYKANIPAWYAQPILCKC